MGLPNLNKLIFHKTFDVLLFKYHGIHVNNMLFIDNTPYKSLFNEPFNVIFLWHFLIVFWWLQRDDNYLFSIVFFYLKSFHCSRYGVGTFVKDKCFCHIRNINHNDARYYKILIVKCTTRCDVLYYKNAKMKMKKICDYFLLLSSHSWTS
jgi:hypothetical protein